MDMLTFDVGAPFVLGLGARDLCRARTKARISVHMITFLSAKLELKNCSLLIGGL